MKKLALIALAGAGFALAPAPNSNAGVAIGIGVGFPVGYPYYPYYDADTHIPTTDITDHTTDITDRRFIGITATVVTIRGGTTATTSNWY
jgi:hypothetical protein